MELSVYLDAEVVGDPDQIEWTSLRMAGVDRRLPDRIGCEVVTFRGVATGAALHVSSAGGVEKTMVAGSLTEGGGSHCVGPWLRPKEGAALEAIVSQNGAKAWMSTVHSPHAIPFFV